MGRRRIFLIASVAVVSGVFGVALSRSGLVGRMNQISPAPPSTRRVAERPNIDLGNYNVLRTELESERATLWSRYQRAMGPSERQAIINRARESFVLSVNDKILPHWYGTEWDFNGTTETPAQGKIACGYFVSTVLRDLGMKVQRARLAQQPSENIILSLTTPDHVKRFRQVPIRSFVEAVKNWGPGLYVVGLDNHVGFILSTTDEVYFIHSSYVDPFCVVKELGVESHILTASRYRVLGKLSEDDGLLLKWLRGDQFTTRGEPHS